MSFDVDAAVNMFLILSAVLVFVAGLWVVMERLDDDYGVPPPLSLAVVGITLISIAAGVSA